MHWNHRVFKEYDYTYEDEAQYSYNIRECYYNDEYEIIGWTADGIDPYGENLEDLKAELARMLSACDLPILEIDPEDENKLLNAVQGKAFDPDEPITTYNSIEELIADLDSDDEAAAINKWEEEGGGLWQ